MLDSHAQKRAGQTAGDVIFKETNSMNLLTINAPPPLPRRISAFEGIEKKIEMKRCATHDV